MQSQHLAVLRSICAKLKNKPLNWAITGSMGFALQGIAIAVHDIDIQTDRASAYAIERLFAEHMTRKVRFSSTDRIRSHFGAFELGGIQVEIMGDIQKKLDDGTWETPINPHDHLVWVKYADMEIPVLSLEYEYQAYLKLGRTEKADTLRQHLNKNRD